MWHCGKTQSQHYNNEHYNYNDDKDMRASMLFEFFDDLISCQNPWYIMGPRKHDNKETYFENMIIFLVVLGYKRRSAINLEVDITSLKWTTKR